MKKIFICLIAVIMFPSLVAAQSVSWNCGRCITIHDGIVESETMDLFRVEIRRTMIDFGNGDEPALFLRFFDSNGKGAGWYCFGKGHKSTFSRCDREFYDKSTGDYVTAYVLTEDAGSDHPLHLVSFILDDDFNSVEIHVKDARDHRYEYVWTPMRRTDDISPSLVRLLKSAVNDGILREVDYYDNSVFRVIPKE